MLLLFIIQIRASKGVRLISKLELLWLQTADHFPPCHSSTLPVVYGVRCWILWSLIISYLHQHLTYLKIRNQVFKPFDSFPLFWARLKGNLKTICTRTVAENWPADVTDAFSLLPMSHVVFREVRGVRQSPPTSCFLISLWRLWGLKGMTGGMRQDVLP